MVVVTSSLPIEAELLVGGVALQEYDNDEEEVNVKTVTKYVEAKSGAEFAIRCRFTVEPPHDIITRIFLDDKYAMGQLALLKYFRGGPLEQTTYGVRSNKGGEWTLAKFAFSDLNTVDSSGRTLDDKLMNDLKGMGQVSLDFHYITNLRNSTRTLERSNKTILDDIPEKALKGRSLSHQLTLRDPTPTQSIDVMESDYVDSSGEPFASVHFKYRSRDSLKALLVIPRSPSPVPLEERDVDTLSPQEMRELLRLQRQRGGAAQAVKPEGGVKRERPRERSGIANDASDDDDISFVSAKRRRLPVTVNEDGVETIDLT